MEKVSELCAQLIELQDERNDYMVQDDKLAAQKMCPRGLSRKMVRESIRDVDTEYTQTLAQILMLASGQSLSTELLTMLPENHPAMMAEAA
jgi:hypothetical protein